MNVPEKDRRVFEKFRAHVKELRETRFGKAILDSSTATVQWSEGTTPSMPKFDEDDFRSFILGVRLLAQNNDRVSLGKIWDLAVETFDVNDPSHDWLARFNRARMPYNLHIMCENSFADTDGNSYTYAEIVDVFLWGKYSHLKEQHESTLKKWEESPLTFQLMKQSFVFSMGILLDCAEKLSNEIDLALSGKKESACNVDEAPTAESAFRFNPKMRKQVQDLSEEVVAFAKFRLKLMTSLVKSIERHASEMGGVSPASLDPHNEREDGLGSAKNLSSLGEVIGYEIGFSGARVSVNGEELDPDRSITFEITHTEKWDTKVTIYSEFSPTSIVVIPRFSDDVGEAIHAASDHCTALFDGWPLPEAKVSEAFNKAALQQQGFPGKSTV